MKYKEKSKKRATVELNFSSLNLCLNTLNKVNEKRDCNFNGKERWGIKFNIKISFSSCWADPNNCKLKY